MHPGAGAAEQNAPGGGAAEQNAPSGGKRLYLAIKLLSNPMIFNGKVENSTFKNKKFACGATLFNQSSPF